MNEQLDKALGLLERVTRAMAKRPEELKMQVERSAGGIEVSFVVNSADSKRLVGSSGRNIKHLSALLRMLVKDRTIETNIRDFTANLMPEHPYAPYVPQPDWPRIMISELLRDIVETVFEMPAIITTLPGPRSAQMWAEVQDELDGNQTLAQLDQVVTVLFVSIGENHGMKVYAHVKDWIKTREETDASATR